MELTLNKNVDDSVDILFHKPYSMRSGDSHLWVVLAKWLNYYNKVEFVTWLYSAETQGLSGGHYFLNLADAKVDYRKRGI